MTLYLPPWAPERFRQQEICEQHPHFDRLKLLLTSQEMKSVWGKLEKQTRKPSECPGGVHPLDAYLYAAHADRWQTAGIELNKEVEKSKEAEKILRGMIRNIKELDKNMNSLLSCFGGEKASLQDLLTAASSLGVNVNKIEPDVYIAASKDANDIEISHPQSKYFPAIRPAGTFFSYWIEGLQSIETVFSEFEKKLHKINSKIYTSGRRSDASAKNGTDKIDTERIARILANSLIKCTVKYFKKPCLPQIAGTIWVLVGHNYSPSALSKKKKEMNL